MLHSVNVIVRGYLLSEIDQRHRFLNDLQLLLEKHDATIEAEDHWMGYAECGQDVRMTVEFEDYRIDPINLTSFIDKRTDWKILDKE